MVFWVGQLLPGIEVPDFYGGIATAGDDASAVRRNRDRPHRRRRLPRSTRFVAQRAQQLARVGVPDQDGAIETAGDDAFAIRRERDRRYRFGIAAHGAQRLPAAGVPEPDR